MDYHPGDRNARASRTHPDLHEHALVDLILAACDQSDDQDEIVRLVDDLVHRRHPTQRLPARAAAHGPPALVRETCSRAA